MTGEFTGKGAPLDEAGMAEVTGKLGTGPAEIWAVLTVETQGCGFLRDRRPFILYERHIFSRETHHRFDLADPDISNRAAGGYGAGGANQYDRLLRAIGLDRRAALRSASWGIGQVMGFNAENAGYRDVEEMAAAMAASETEQLLAMSGEILHNKLDRPLRSHDWAAFARGYNGPDYGKNSYDTRLFAAHRKFSAGALPDLRLRAAQMYLTYLGYQPGPVDGVMGKLTRSAINGFQEDQGLPATDDVDGELVLTLKDCVEKLS